MTTPTDELDPSELDLEQQFGQCAPHDPMGVQYGAADSADFSEGTWTFKMHGDWKVAAGEFAIVPRAEFAAQVSAQAKPLLAKAVEALKAEQSRHPQWDQKSEATNTEHYEDGVRDGVGFAIKALQDQGGA